MYIMKKILIVDDQQEVRELVALTLRDENYQILQARSGEEAVKTAKTETPELIIMDIVMPGSMDGLEATRKIKSDSMTNDCKVIMLTAQDKDSEIEEGYKAGAAGYIAKPFSPLDLIKKVEENLKDYNCTNL